MVFCNAKTVILLIGWYTTSCRENYEPMSLHRTVGKVLVSKFVFKSFYKILNCIFFILDVVYKSFINELYVYFVYKCIVFIQNTCTHLRI